MVAAIADGDQPRPEGRLGSIDLPPGQLRLLHAVATAANEASEAGALAPRLLDLVCSAYGWPGGVLVHRVEDPEPELLGSHGAVPAEALTAPATGEPGLVYVPLPDVDGAAPSALVFAHGTTCVEPQQLAVLELVAHETARVLERQVSAERARRDKERFRSVFDLSPLPMALTLGFSGTYGLVNHSFCTLLGRTPEQLIGLSAMTIVHPDDLDRVQPAGQRALESSDGRHQTEMRLLHADGSVVITLITLAWMDGPDGSRNLLTQVEDITARRTVEGLLRQQAERDSLTGLANRMHLNQYLESLGERSQACVALFVDVDGFKLVNDSHGHGAGDQVLVEVARRFSQVGAEADLVARFGGDEFVIVRPMPAPHDDLVAEREGRQLANELRAALERPICTPRGKLTVSASIGIASGVVRDGGAEALVQQADTAMYHAKVLGKDRCELYDAQLHQRTLEHQHTDALLRHALEEERFVVHYQPIVDLADGATVGVEALVRMRDRDGLLVPPARFIPAAERNGLVVPMGAWVLREGCRTVARIREQTGRPLTLSVNVAARQAARPDLSSTVLDALEECGLPEEALTLELTETALLEADDATLRQLIGLRERGVRVALDDFGTGYSSLTYLRAFPVSHLKVDRSFVRGMVGSEGDLAIVRAVTGLAQDLGLQWVAEGIEEVEQHRAVAALGGGLGQGYLFGRPMPEADLLEQLSRPAG